MAFPCPQVLLHPRRKCDHEDPAPHRHRAGPDGHRRQRLRCSRADRIDNREARQAERINEGRRSGELTWLEAQRLRAEQARIHRMERWAKSDGYISREEARRIEQAQDAASRHIRQEKHDGQTTWWSR